MESYYIMKGSKKVDSFYLNELPIKHVHYLDKKVSEQFFEVDNLGFFERLIPLRMFPIRQNSAIFFKELSEAQDYLNHAKESIKNDERFCERIKNKLLKYIETFKIQSN
jgi:hypothetical protein